MARMYGPRASAFAPLSGVKQTSSEHAKNDAHDPKATLPSARSRLAEVIGVKGERLKPSCRSVNHLRCPRFTHVQLSRQSRSSYAPHARGDAALDARRNALAVTAYLPARAYRG